MRISKESQKTGSDNLIVCMKVDTLDAELMDLKLHSAGKCRVLKKVVRLPGKYRKREGIFV
ncbi:MAG: hypothetical protein LUG27_01920 [Clostridiales bacterium]|nr:hypothetical protein [Clostridiales bacterium]